MARRKYLLRRLMAVLTLLTAFYGYGASSVLIWPVDPVLEEQDRASAVWLENRHESPIYIQVRVLRWRQIDGENRYDEQKEVSASPPFALIEPGKRQLIRLIKNLPPAAGEEKAYRVFVDEIPRADERGEPQQRSAGISFRMRYSIPLFASGAGIWTKQKYEYPRDIKQASAPTLSYRIVQNRGKKWLEIKNDGPVHARISKLSRRSTIIVDGLVGYVLPGATMRFALPAGPAADGSGGLQAMINDNPEPVTIRRRGNA